MSSSVPTIALVGKPNCGKSALFNTLTGARQKVANYPGVTVERKQGTMSQDGKRVSIIDLPGSYGLHAESMDEQVTSDALQDKLDGIRLDLVVCVADATNLRLSLPLILETISLGLPTVVVLNKRDMAEKLGVEVSVEHLSEELAVPVVTTTSTNHADVTALKKLVIQTLETQEERMVPKPFVPCGYSDRVRHIMQVALVSPGIRHKATEKLDQMLLHPLGGMACFLAIIFLMFQGVFNLAEAPMDMIDGGVTSLINLVEQHVPEGAFRSLLGNGIIAGVGSVIIFLPQILILFFFILLLEDSGYMARAAFLLDRVMGRVGLHGKAFIPLLSSFACAIPGIMATRTIENPRDRLVTILIAPLMTCSARLPVYALIISAFIPNIEVFGPFRLQGMVLFGLYVIGILSAMTVAFVMRRFFMKGTRTPLMLEMPDYCVPNVRNLLLGLMERTKVFLMRAGKIILPLMILVWFLSSYPAAPEGAEESAILYSFAGMMGQFLAPVFAPLGFSRQMVVALIPGMAAREVAVGVLGTVYALSSEADIESLGAILAAEWSIPTALAFLTWYIFAPQCLPTLGVAKRETNSWVWPMVMLVYLMGLAYIFSYIVYHVSQQVMGL